MELILTAWTTGLCATPGKKKYNVMNENTNAQNTRVRQLQSGANIGAKWGSFVSNAVMTLNVNVNPNVNVGAFCIGAR